MLSTILKGFIYLVEFMYISKRANNLFYSLKCTVLIVKYYLLNRDLSFNLSHTHQIQDFMLNYLLILYFTLFTLFIL